MTQEQIDFLEGLEGLNTSEHIRRAVDEYIEKKKGQSVSATPTGKGGGVNVSQNKG